ncbi:MAG: pyridoxal phosphate-dependent aminotransferase [Thermodesulfobacteriales bacterium]|jgi:aspartate aminotransferase|nr:MAG: pyridoxal phosphate-dependent aminotransferase [Thermodesulfobacteriales bacterium]
MKLSARAERLQPSATLTITAKAKALKSQGVDVIGFGAGEPDFDSPDHVKEAAIKAINEGMTKYTGVGGIDELKDAIIYRLKEDHNLEYEKSEIIASVGAKHTLYNVIQVLFDKGDEVIVPAPYWVSYPEQIKLAEATPVILETKESDGFKITPTALKPHINSNTKALILNYPSNPTGATYNEEELRAIVDVAMDAGLIIISDEIYEKIIYGGIKHIPVASLGEDIKKATILVNGVSKTYSMTGWRIGYAAGDKGVISAMSKLQGQSTSNPTSISQWAAIAALRGDHQIIDDRTKEFEQRKNYIVEKLNDIPQINCFDPQGAFYVFPNVSGCYGKEYNGKIIKDSLDFTEFILDEAKVAVVPGVAFGSDDHVRISYATSMDDIVKGIDRMTEAIKKLS